MTSQPISRIVACIRSTTIDIGDTTGHFISSEDLRALAAVALERQEYNAFLDSGSTRSPTPTDLQGFNSLSTEDEFSLQAQADFEAARKRKGELANKLRRIRYQIETATNREDKISLNLAEGRVTKEIAREERTIQSYFRTRDV